MSLNNLKNASLNKKTLHKQPILFSFNDKKTEE